MFYAASEIVFWILLAAVVGGGIGYGLAQGKALRINKRLTQSRADAPMERELAIAWDTIEDLNRRLQVAHETIRDGDKRGGTANDDELIEIAPVADTANASEATGVEAEAAGAVVPPVDDAKDTVIDMSASRPPAKTEASTGTTAKTPAAKTPAAKKPAAKKPAAKKPPTAKTKTSAKAKTAVPKTSATKSAAAKPAAKKPPAAKAEAVPDESVGKRLSERVASASIANQVDFTDGA